MNENLKRWWQGRTLREQRLLLALGGVASFVFVWLLVIRPLSDSLSEARERHGEAVIALAEARAGAAMLQTAETDRPPPLSAPLDSLLNQSATEAGFQVNRIDRLGPNQATVVIDAARPQAFFGWVNQMENERGLIVERLTATTNADQTLSVQATFRARAG